jgi:hypothetical protein
VGQEWAIRDLNWIAAFLTLVLFGSRWPVFLVAALALGVVLLGLAGRRLVLRRRAAKVNDAKPYWVDELRGPADS